MTIADRERRRVVSHEIQAQDVADKTYRSTRFKKLQSKQLADLVDRHNNDADTENSVKRFSRQLLTDCGLVARRRSGFEVAQLRFDVVLELQTVLALERK